MDPSGDCQISPSDMLISPKWGFLLSVLLLVNLSLVAWAAAFVPDEPPAATPQVSATAPPVDSHQPASVIAGAASTNSGASEVAMAPAVEAPTSPPPAEAAPAPASDDPTPIASIEAEWAPDSTESASSPPESSPPEPGQSEPSESTAETPLPEVPAGLVVINPPTTGGAVHFLLANEVITLEPGEFHVVAEIDERVVKFDRGEDFGLVEQKVSDEVWMFAVGPRGWSFELVDHEQAPRRLQGCRPRSGSAEPSTAEPSTSEPSTSES